MLSVPFLKFPGVVEFYRLPFNSTGDETRGLTFTASLICFNIEHCALNPQ